MRSGWLAIVLIVCAPLAGAQFKWVDASGRVATATSRPPVAHDIERLEGVVKGAKRDPQAALPYQLQSTIRDFPVTCTRWPVAPGATPAARC